MALHLHVQLVQVLVAQGALAAIQAVLVQVVATADFLAPVVPLARQEPAVPAATAASAAIRLRQAAAPQPLRRIKTCTHNPLTTGECGG